MSYLVTISPEVVLGAEVLVWVLRPVCAGVLVLLVGNVLPMGVPPDLSVDAGNDDAGDRDAVPWSAVVLMRFLSLMFQMSMSS